MPIKHFEKGILEASLFIQMFSSPQLWLSVRPNLFFLGYVFVDIKSEI